MPDLHTYDIIDIAAAKAVFAARGTERTLRRGEYFCRMDRPVREIGIVLSGGFAFSHPDEKGHDQILSMAFDGEFVSAVVSHPDGSSMFDVRALCRSRITVMPQEQFFGCMEQKKTGFRADLISGIAYGLLKRGISWRCETPEQRYATLLERLPDIRKFVPMSDIAAWLGITREAFSRMRSRNP